MFQHGQIQLRTVEERDLEALRALRNHPTTWFNLTDPVLIDGESQKKWFQGLQARADRKYFVPSSSDHDFLGVVRMDEIDRQNRSIRVGLDILPELRGKGWGEKSYQTILKYSFDFLNFHRVWLCVLDYNENALGLYRKVGFQEEGRYR
ncbi:MAG: GNAT family N-acetyltransferase, partial [Bdellovibrionota bacterium]